MYKWMAEINVSFNFYCEQDRKYDNFFSGKPSSSNTLFDKIYQTLVLKCNIFYLFGRCLLSFLLTSYFFVQALLYAHIIHHNS